MFLVSPALAATLEVGPGAAYATLAGALADAADGDTVLVTAPTLAEQVTITNRAVRIVSRVGTRWTGPLTTQLAFLDIGAGADVLVSGFVFEGFGGAYAGFVRDGHLTVRGCDLSGFESAFVVTGGRLDAADSTFHDWFFGPVLSVSAGEVRLFRVELRDGAIDDAAASVTGGTLSSRGSSWSGFWNRGTQTGGAAFCVGACSFDNDRFVGNEAFFGAALFGNVAAENSIFCENVGGGVVQGGTRLHNDAFLDNVDTSGVGIVLAQGDLDLAHNAFVDNDAFGVSAVLALAGTVTSTSNVYARNGGTAEALFALGGAITSQWDTFFDNAAGDANGVTLDATALVGVDPQLRSAAGCTWRRARPVAGSPLVDAGDPAETDPDGSPADRGVTGGPDAR